MQEAALIVMSVKAELAISGKLLTRTALAPFGCEKVKIKQGENEDKSAGKLVVLNFPDEEMNDKQGPSGSGKNEKRDDKEEEDRQPEEAMEKDPDRAGKDDDKTSAGGVSSLDFNFLDDYKIETETLERTTEPAEDGTSSLEPPSASMNLSCDLPRRRRIEGAARVPFLRTLPE